MKYKIVENDKQYNEYCEIHEKLTHKDHIKYNDEINLIELLIEDYENRTAQPKTEMNPVELISYIIEEEEISKTELANQLKVSKQLISDILGYRRGISLDMVNKLCDRFKMQPLAFTRPYKLKARKGVGKRSVA
jgi:HTH-type transcriptional regulator/antitoxin HigA